MPPQLRLCDAVESPRRRYVSSMCARYGSTSKQCAIVDSERAAGDVRVGSDEVAKRGLVVARPCRKRLHCPVGTLARPLRLDDQRGQHLLREHDAAVELDVLRHVLGLDAQSRRRSASRDARCSRRARTRREGSPARPMSARCRARARARRPPSRSRRSRAARGRVRQRARRGSGLRLCGIADDPFWRNPKGSSTSSTSVICSRRIVVASRSSTAPSSASAVTKDACRSRASTCVATGATARLSPLHTCSSISGGTLACVPTAPVICPTAISAVAAASRVRARRTSSTKFASLMPRVSGSAWTPWVRPIITVSRCRSACSISAATSDSVSASITPCSVTELRRERGVHDVGRGQPEVEVPSRLADGLLDRRDEGRDVVPLLGLELSDALGVDARTLQSGQRLDRNPTELSPSFTREQLDIQPSLQSGSVTEDLRDLLRGVPGDHVRSFYRGDRRHLPAPGHRASRRLPRRSRKHTGGVRGRDRAGR